MYKKNRILAVVPARSGSKGIKLKNIRLLNGIPLIGYTANLIDQLNIIDEAIVSTDSNKIAKIAKKYGLDVPFLRPKNLSGDLVSDLEVLNHVLSDMRKKMNKDFEIILLLPPTSPMRLKVDVTKVIKKLIDQNLDSVWTVSKSDKKNHPLKQLKINGYNLCYADKNGETIIARQQLKSFYQRNGVVYAFTKNCLKTQKRILGKRAGYVLINRPVVNIDDKFDMEIAEFLLKKNKIYKNLNKKRK